MPCTRAFDVSGLGSNLLNDRRTTDRERALYADTLRFNFLLWWRPDHVHDEQTGKHKSAHQSYNVNYAGSSNGGVVPGTHPNYPLKPLVLFGSFRGPHPNYQQKIPTSRRAKQSHHCGRSRMMAHEARQAWRNPLWNSQIPGEAISRAKQAPFPVPPGVAGD